MPARSISSRWTRSALRRMASISRVILPGIRSCTSFQRECKMKDDAGLGRREPEPAAMGIYDRAANRQPHAHPFRLGGEERFEQAAGDRGIDAAAGVLDLDDDLILALAL